MTRESVSENYELLYEQVGSVIDIRNRSNWILGLFTTVSSSQCQCIQSSLACMWGASVCHMVHTLDTEHHKAGPGHKEREHGERENSVNHRNLNVLRTFIL